MRVSVWSVTLAAMDGTWSLAVVQRGIHVTPALDWDVGEGPELWDAGRSGRNPPDFSVTSAAENLSINDHRKRAALQISGGLNTLFFLHLSPRSCHHGVQREEEEGEAAGFQGV